jgi:hypothetical protein
MSENDTTIFFLNFRFIFGDLFEMLEIADFYKFPVANTGLTQIIKNKTLNFKTAKKKNNLIAIFRNFLLFFFRDHKKVLK